MAGLQVSAGVRFGPGQVTCAARRILGRLGVLGRVGDGDGRRAGLARPWIARRGLAVERQVEDLAERLARVLRGVKRCRSPELRNSDLPSGAKAIDRPELAALAARRIAPEHAAARPAAQPPADATSLRARQREPAAAVRRRLRIGEIDQAGRPRSPARRRRRASRPGSTRPPAARRRPALCAGGRHRPATACPASRSPAPCSSSERRSPAGSPSPRARRRSRPRVDGERAVAAPIGPRLPRAPRRTRPATASSGGLHQAAGHPDCSFR